MPLQQYVCPECEHVGAHNPSSRPPFCHRCDFKVVMVKSNNGVPEQLKRTYRLTFFDHEGSRVNKEAWFTDGGEISAHKWAHDWAYAHANKGAYILKDITDGN